MTIDNCGLPVQGMINPSDIQADLPQIVTSTGQVIPSDWDQFVCCMNRIITQHPWVAGGVVVGLFLLVSKRK